MYVAPRRDSNVGLSGLPNPRHNGRGGGPRELTSTPGFGPALGPLSRPWGWADRLKRASAYAGIGESKMIDNLESRTANAAQGRKERSR